MEKVSKEIAIADINEWLDFKKVNSRKRETYADNIDTLVDAVMAGVLSRGDDNTLRHQLIFPIQNDKEETTVDVFEYKPRVKVGVIQSRMQGVKATDADGRVTALVCALTGKPKEVVRGLDTEDYSIAQAIAIFFL